MQIDENVAKSVGFFTVIGVAFAMIIKQSVRIFWSDIKTNAEASAATNLVKNLQRENARMSSQISELITDKLGLINRIAKLETSVAKLVLMEERNSFMVSQMSQHENKIIELTKENTILKSLKKK